MNQRYLPGYLLAFLVVYNLLLSNLQAFSATTRSVLWVESPTPTTEPDVDQNLPILGNVPTPIPVPMLPKPEELRAKQVIEVNSMAYLPLITNAELGTMNAQNLQLSETSLERLATWSPVENTLIFLSLTNLPSSPGKLAYDIEYYNLTTELRYKIAEGGYPGQMRFSTGGTKISFWYNDAPYQTKVKEKVTDRVMTNFTPVKGAFSPNGTELMYVTNNDTVYIHNVENGMEQKLGYVQGISHLLSLSPAWSPNGKWVAFAIDSEIVLINPSSDTPFAPMHISGFPAIEGEISSIRQYLIWSDDSSTLFGFNGKPLHSFKAMGTVSPIPAERTLYSFDGNYNVEYKNHELFLHNRATGTVKFLTKNQETLDRVADLLPSIHSQAPYPLNQFESTSLIADAFDFPLCYPNFDGCRVDGSYDSSHPGHDMNGACNGGRDCDLGWSVNAVANGRVVYSDYHGSNSSTWGNIILLEHTLPDGTKRWSQYAHLDQRLVEYGDGNVWVSKGDKIGTVGKGHNNQFYAHLHFEIRVQNIPAYAWYTGSNYVQYYTNPSEFINNHRRIGSGGGSDCPNYAYNGVVLFDDKQCRGAKFEHSSASDLINLTDVGWNDRAQSIHVGSGWSVKTFEHTNREGASRCIAGSMWDLSVDYFDNSNVVMWKQISSVEIFNNSSCSGGSPTGEVKLYDQANSDGTVVFSGGTGFSNSPSANSYRLEMPSGWSVWTYRDDNKGGESRCWSVSVPNLQDHGWQNAIQSLEAYSSNVCPPPTPGSPNLQSPATGSTFNEGQPIVLTWQSAGNATEYYGEISGGPAPFSFGWQGSTAKDIGSQWAGYTYTWKVKARNSSAESGWSNAWAFTVKPAAPINLSAQSASCNQINLIWTDSSGSEDGYRIYRNGVEIGQVGANVIRYESQNLNPDSNYAYMVKAFRNSIESDASNTADANTGACAPLAVVTVDEAPDPLVMKGGDYKTTTYTFAESAGIAVHIVQRTARFTLLDGMTTVSELIGPYPNTITMAANSTAQWIDNIYLPMEVVQNALDQGNTGVLLKTTFSGTDSTGRSVFVNSTLRINFDSCNDIAEPNETAQQATTISYNQTHNAVICPIGDSDFYMFTGTAGDRIQIDIDAVVHNSLLDSVVYLFDSDGTTLITASDDSDNSVDSRLVTELPHTGQYYVRVRHYSNTSGGSAYFYTVRLSVDNAEPVIEILSPTNNGWLQPTKHIITVTASDNETAVHHVDFHFHDNNWANPEWLWLGSDLDGSDGWSWELDTSTLTEDESVAIFAYAYDNVGHPKGYGAYNLKVDRTPPSSTVVSLPEKISNAQFTVQWQGTDNYTPNTQLIYDVQYQLDCTRIWIDWISKEKLTEAIFTGQAGYSYCFRSRAYDLPGNVEAWSEQPDARTQILLDTPTPTFTSTPTATPQTVTPTPTATVSKPPLAGHAIYLPSIQQNSKGGSLIVTVTPLPSPTETPNPSQLLAYAVNQNGNVDIYQMRSDGSAPKNLSNHPAFEWGPSWSPDGEQIAFVSNRDGNLEIYVMNADGSAQRRLTQNGLYDVGPVWSPDGQWIAYKSFENGDYRIYLLKSDGSSQQLLTTGANSDWRMSWSPDGARLAFSSFRDGNGEIYLINADGTGLTRITNEPTEDNDAAWSPDGGKLAFVSKRDGNQEIYVVSIDGANPIRLTNNPATDSIPVWSPDGQKLAFTSNRDGFDAVYLMNPDGSAQTRITNGPYGSNFAVWRPR